MTTDVRLLSTYKGFPPQSIISLPDAEATSLVSVNNATLTLTGGTRRYQDLAPLSNAAVYTPVGVQTIGQNQRFSITIPEGFVLTTKVATGGVGTLQAVDASGAAIGSPVALSGTTTQSNAAGTRRYVITCAAGSIDASVGDAVLVIAQTVTDSLSPKDGLVIKRFTDLRNVTLSTGGGLTGVATIDQNSPYGGPALKLVLTAGVSAGTYDVAMSNINVANFDGHVAVEAWINDPLKIPQVSTYIGTTGLTLSNQYNRTIASGGEKIGGARVIDSGPVLTPNTSTFTFGTDPLQQVKFRIFVAADQTTTVWIRSFHVLARQRPIICFTYDDDYANWVTDVLPLAAANNIPLTFGVNTADIVAATGGTHISSDGVKQLVAAGHQVGSHCVNNYKLQTLNGQGNGEDNGTGTSVDALTYASDFATAKAYLSSLGVPADHFCYHPWVQGGMDNVGMEFLRSEGVDIARNIGAPNSVNTYGVALGNNAYALRAFGLGNTNTLAQCIAAVDQCIKYGGLLVFMGHNTAEVASDSITFAKSDLAALFAYVGALKSSGAADVLRIMDLRNLFRNMGLLDRPDTNPKPVVRQIGRKLLANFNITTDQAITLVPGDFVITEVAFTKTTRSMTTAAGGVYTAASKGGTAIVAASQAYTGLTVATDVVIAPAVASPTVSGTVYLSLTTAQGAAGTVDVFVFGYPA